MTFNNYANIYVSPRQQKIMIYRWGISTYHISGMGNISNDNINKWTDRIVKTETKEPPPENGTITLHPDFREDYYGQIQ